MNTSTSSATEVLAATLAPLIENFCGLPTEISIDGEGNLHIVTRGGDRIPALGGFVGGDNHATLQRGSMFWRETSGRIPFPTAKLYPLLADAGWFDV